MSGRDGSHDCFLLPANNSHNNSHNIFFGSAITKCPGNDQALDDEQQAEADGCRRPGQCIVSTLSNGRNPTPQHYAKL